MSFNIEYSGTSHSPEMKIKVAGLPKGEEFSKSELQYFLDRRRPGTADNVSARNEKDEPVFISGVTKKDDDTFVTDGNMFEAVIKNEDAKPEDYEYLKDTPRPGHSDYTAYVKYGSFEPGGGQFSGRMTALTCILGGICLQALKRRGISIRAVVAETGDINAAREKSDSVGGIICAEATGVPAGIGGPFDKGLESRLSSALFAIPAVKGVEFGAGFSAAFMTGSESNDAFEIKNGEIRTVTNNCGGILGGISTGMPITFRVAFKPTPSIGLPQQTVNLKTKTVQTISVKGRHDPCVVPRAVPVVEAVTAITLFEVLKEENKL